MRPGSRFATLWAHNDKLQGQKKHDVLPHDATANRAECVRATTLMAMIRQCRAEATPREWLIDCVISCRRDLHAYNCARARVQRARKSQFSVKSHVQNPVAVVGKKSAERHRFSSTIYWEDGIQDGIGSFAVGIRCDNIIESRTPVTRKQ